MGAKRKLVEYMVNINGCHICISHHIGTSGYPCVWKDGKNQNLHRVLYEEKYGPLGDLEARHDCDTPACINLEHIRPGTVLDNAQDRTKRGRNNPPRGERAGNTHLTSKEVEDIIHAIGSQKSIGKRFNISQSEVSRIKNGKRWLKV